MKFKILSIIVASVAGLLVASTVWAQTYQFEGEVSAGQIKFENAVGAEADVDQLSANIRYYLRPISTTSGPLSERAFLDKAAFVGINVNQLKGETGATADTLSPEVRFVTQGNLIIEADYSQVKADGADDRSAYSLGLGKYLDDRSEAVLVYSEPNDDLKIIAGRYKTLRPGSSANTYLGYEAGLGYLDASFDTGFQLIFNGTYHFSDVFSAGAGVNYRTISEFDETAFNVRGQYFISEKLFGKIGFVSASNTDDLSITEINLSVGGRF